MIPTSLKRISFLLIFIAIAVNTNLYAQITQISPAFPSENDEVEIVFDGTQGNGNLAGFTGDVFLWTGVITNESTSDNDWKFVQANDFNTDFPERLKATPLGDSKWSFAFGPSVRTFYGINDPTIKVEKIALLFRGVQNGQVAEVGRAENDADIFVQMFESGLNVQFTKPTDELTFFTVNEPFTIEGLGNVDGNNSITLTLEIDGEVVETVNGGSLSFDYTPTSPGTFELNLIGTSSGLIPDTATANVVVNPEIANQARPAGLRDGITYSPDGRSVILSLFAPNKEFVYVIGDFNNWLPDTEFFMKRDQVNADSTYWWIEIDGLTPGSQVGFQYLVDGELRVTDPYVELILDPNDDKFIDSETFPNLKPYPQGKTDFQVGVLQPGKPKFDFEVDDFEKPEPEELIIYELLVRDFTKNHNYDTLIDSLDYLADLGVNAIELMPIMEFEGNSSWGYNPSFHLAVDKYYGTENDLKRFIDECHKRGIAVILDMVLNHAFGQSPLVRLYSSGNFGPPTEQNPWLNVQARHPFNVGFDFNHESAATQHFVDRVNQHWLEKFKFDGFRFDLSKGFTQKNTLGDVGAWGQFDQSRVDILQRMADKIWEVDPDAYVILEHLAEFSEEKVLSEYRTNEGKDGMFLWSNLNRPYNQLSMGFWNSDDFVNSINGAWFGNTGFTVPNQVTYMESHDEQWMMLRNLKFGNTSNSSHNVQNLNIALERQKIAGAFFLTIPGPKMLWQFGELGYGGGPDECLKPGGGGNGECLASDPGRTGEKPVRWEYYKDPDRKKLYKTWSAINKARNDYGIFADPTTQVETEIGEDRAFRWIKLSNDTLQALVVGNFDVVEREFTLPLGDGEFGQWFDYFSGNPEDFQPQNLSRTFQPAEFHIYTTEPLETPESGLVTNIEDVVDGAGTQPEKFELKQNFPNPFNPSTRIEYSLAQSSTVNLDLYDVLGRKVATLINSQRQTAGTHSLNFNAGNLSTGVYILFMQAGDFTSSRKIMLIK